MGAGLFYGRIHGYSIALDAANLLLPARFPPPRCFLLSSSLALLLITFPSTNMLLKGALLLSALTSVLATPILQARENSGSSSSSSDWDAAWEKARSIVSKMTFDEKINFTVSSENLSLHLTRAHLAISLQEFRTVGIQGSGQTHSIDRFNISSLTFSDSPTGVNSRFSSQFPAQVTAAATWDLDLIYKRAEAMGVEFAEVGVNTPLSIVIGKLATSFRPFALKSSLS